MPDIIRVETLHDIIDSYMNDSGMQEYALKSAEKRNIIIPRFSEIMQKFVTGSFNLREYCDALTTAFKETGESWSAKGYGFMSPMYKIIKTHGPTAQTHLRELLTDLDAKNMGIKIELLYKFLQDERARLRQAGTSPGEIAEAGKSATIISLIALWLHPEQEPIVYHEETRRGFTWLINKHLFTPTQKLYINQDSAIIKTSHDHQAFQAAVNELLRLHPLLKNSPYWSEYFFGWIVNTRIEVQETITRDEKPGGNDSPLSALIKNDKLIPKLEPLLTNLIRKVQHEIIVEESVVRRIYHALLAGHVILSGPPGTGKTELARLIPETLWKSPENADENEDDPRSSETAYTTRLITATDEWSVRTLISGITPVSKNGNVAYKVQYGHLTSTILKNWFLQGDSPEEWTTASRTLVTSSSGVKQGTERTFRGQWLVIDEFNRAPIDLALGDALTALGGNDILRVATENGSMELPIPKDFRIIGTLNSFDRNYLNQISEALKRRFSFVEILPPGRRLREAEQAMVLHKAIDQVSHLRKAIYPENEISPWDTLAIEADGEGPYIITWPDELYPFRQAFETAWRVFEVIRIYRQLGTAQAISLVRHMLIAGLLQGYSTHEEWTGLALDAALCDTLADQLQVLLPDEIDVLLLYLTIPPTEFSTAYNNHLDELKDRKQRLYKQLLALGNISDEQGEPYLTDEEIEGIARKNVPVVAPEKLTKIFHLSDPISRLPQFIRRLRTYKTERGL